MGWEVSEKVRLKQRPCKDSAVSQGHMESDAALGCSIEVSTQGITNKNLSSDKFVRYGEKSAD